MDIKIAKPRNEKSPNYKAFNSKRTNVSLFSEEINSSVSKNNSRKEFFQESKQKLSQSQKYLNFLFACNPYKVKTSLNTPKTKKPLEKLSTKDSELSGFKRRFSNIEDSEGRHWENTTNIEKMWSIFGAEEDSF